MKRVEKGWGHELWIHNDAKYCGKLLFFEQGKKCSLHYHKLKSETFYLQSGRLKIRLSTIDALAQAFITGGPDISSIVFQDRTMMPGDYAEIQPGVVHQMLAEEDSELFEFSTEHFDSDSYRLVKGD